MAEMDYVVMMRESLEKKVAILNCIIAENFKQKDILSAPDSSPDDFDATVETKQKYIDELNALDDGFQQMFDRVKAEFEKDKAPYAEEIKKMQQLIARITDLSVTVQKQEQENKNLMTQKFNFIKTKAREVRKSQSVVSQYYKSMMKPDSNEY